MKCSEDVATLKRFVEKDKIYDFLAGLNMKFDAVRVQVLGKEDLPSLNEKISIIRAKEGRRGVMIKSASVESSALVTRTTSEKNVMLEQSPTKENK